MENSVLTIDDAPSQYFGEKMDLLYVERIPAIFFINGNNVEGRFHWLVEAVKRGYILGNHTHNHKHSSELSLEELDFEIETCDRIIERIYNKANVSRQVKLFRFPFGDKGVPGDPKYPDVFNNSHYQEIQELLKRKGFVNPLLSHLPNHKNELDTYWTFNTKDWALGTGRIKGLDTVEDAKKRIDLLVSNGEPLDVVLIHDHDYTHDAFYHIIDHLKDKGARFYLPKFNGYSK